MACFASCRRSGWVRVLVLILCALFIFATVAAPPAHALTETVALFGAAAVLSAAVAALGYKLSTDSEGQSTLSQMVADFAKVEWATNLVILGTKINGLIDGMQYIRMQVANGKTYLDERIVAWCQQWLGLHGVYDEGGIVVPSSPQLANLQSSDFVLSAASSLPYYSFVVSSFDSIVSHYNLDLSSKCWQISYFGNVDGSFRSYISIIHDLPATLDFTLYNQLGSSVYRSRVRLLYTFYAVTSSGSFSSGTYSNYFAGTFTNDLFDGVFGTPFIYSTEKEQDFVFSNYYRGYGASNDTGLSGTDTIGEDYKDATLEQILAGLKDWAQDWYDAGADSATNSATGAKDLPLTVADDAATANPALNPSAVYNPPFALPWPEVRSGDTSSSAISDGQANVDAAQSTADVAENQTVIDSLVNWALDYISPDTGLFSKFPLCVPYDAYLLVCSSLGVDAVSADTVFSATPSDVSMASAASVATQADTFEPVLHVKHDFELDGHTYPLEVTIDLTPWQPLVTFFREGMALLLIAELIGSEYKRIRGH